MKKKFKITEAQARKLMNLQEQFNSDGVYTYPDGMLQFINVPTSITTPSFNIEWTGGVPELGTIYISLINDDANASLGTIVQTTENNGSYNWEIPCNLVEAGVNYKFFIAQKYQGSGNYNPIYILSNYSQLWGSSYQGPDGGNPPENQLFDLYGIESSSNNPPNYAFSNNNYEYSSTFTISEEVCEDGNEIEEEFDCETFNITTFAAGLNMEVNRFCHDCIYLTAFYNQYTQECDCCPGDEIIDEPCPEGMIGEDHELWPQCMKCWVDPVNNATINTGADCECCRPHDTEVRPHEHKCCCTLDKRTGNCVPGSAVGITPESMSNNGMPYDCKALKKVEIDCMTKEILDGTKPVNPVAVADIQDTLQKNRKERELREEINRIKKILK